MNQKKVQRYIKEECNARKVALLEKNISYGNSAIEPKRIFAKNISPEAQILVRIDDKLSRVANGKPYPGDNDVDDLIGYLILLKVCRRVNGA